jgi:hypothetical protein
MQPDKASAVMTAMIEYRNARATRTGAIPHNETAPVLHRLWLTNRVETLVMPGLVLGIHVFAASQQERRGWPGRSPAMTNIGIRR